MKSSNARTLTVLLLRHGQTESNAGGFLQGHLPIPLNGRGRGQAERLARRLEAFLPRIDALVTSDLVRALETIAPTEQALGLSARRDAAWRERSFGSFEGRYVGETELWRAASGTLNPPGAETIEAMTLRVEGALRSVVAEHAARTCVAVMTHGGVIRTVLRLVHDGRLDPTGATIIADGGTVENGSITTLTVERPDTADPAWTLGAINETTHLG